MPPISVMIKPASASCNLRCEYCFYTDEIRHRGTPNYGIMSKDTAETVVRRFLTAAEGFCTFAFQGGEPTLAGLDFFKNFVELEKKHAAPGVRVQNAIQTNGMLIDAQWARFFSENGFLVGLSLDGNKETHDRYRVRPDGKGSFQTVLRASQLFDAHRVDYNILTVVTAALADKIGAVFGFYKKHGMYYQQYIPCMDPLEGERGVAQYSLTPEKYEAFLKTLFDLWYGELKRGNYISIRFFDNLVHILRGRPPEQCSMLGRCSVQYLLEADGSVFPCDFYAMDGFRLGNITVDEIPAIDARRREIRFIEDTVPVHSECGACKWYPLCRNGCRRDRLPGQNGGPGINYYCKAYQGFFEYSIERFMTIDSLLEHCEK